MITVVCKVAACPWRSSNGFCRSKLMVINENGMCGHIFYNNGQQKVEWRNPIDEIYKDGYVPPEQEKEMIEEKKDVD